jgi:cyclase
MRSASRPVVSRSRGYHTPRVHEVLGILTGHDEGPLSLVNQGGGYVSDAFIKTPEREPQQSRLARTVTRPRGLKSSGPPISGSGVMQSVTRGLVLLWLAAPGTLSAQTLGSVHRFHEIGDGVVVAEPRYGGGNSTLIINDDHVIVVDPQGSDAAAVALIDEIRRLTNVPVRYVIDSHWHGDHQGGNAAFRRAFPGVEIVGHSQTVRGIENEANAEIRGVASFLRDAVRAAETDLETRTQDGHVLTAPQLVQLQRFVDDEVNFLEAIPADFRYEVPDRIVDDVLILSDGTRTVEIRHPGRAHTEGDLLVLLPDDGILIAGDILTVPYVVPRSGFPRAHAAVLAEIATMDYEVLVPGHGQPGDHRVLLNVMRDFLDSVAGSARASIDRGLAVNAAVADAIADPALSPFKSRINWDAVGGLRFLDYRSLLSMTIERAYAEASNG